MLLVSQAIGLALIGGFVALRGDGPPDARFAVYAALGGIAGTVGIAAFYRGLAVGAMGVVAPISGLAAAIPVGVGVAGGERPSALQVAGIALALVGVAFASRESDPAPAAGDLDPPARGAAPAPVAAEPRDTDSGPAAPSGRLAGGVGLALLAALGFGTFFVLIDRASDGDPAWAILGSRLVGITIIASVALALRPAFSPRRSDAAALVAIGVFDIMGQGLFALATTEGLLSIVAVLASLYPVVTIVLARVVLSERLRAVQRVGAVGALAGVALITAG